ncbi:MAG TPA: IPT/TIG domain-containing protein, partial [Candidatus Sulfotelmatobacter sp.]|nr:IPT/TIG domain-containing protein [Candidatus Sulfotelmatobacter sp.]
MTASTLAQTAGPRIIFSDLQSGPNSGGLNNQGSIVTIYGFGFGTSRGTSSITIGGAAAAGYLQWSDTKVSFQVGNSAITGNIVIKVAGMASSGMPFTVRPGRIYFVSPTGSDANAGTSAAPWHSVVKAKNTAVAGDIIYLLNGVNETGLEGSKASLTFAKSGTSSLPI